APSWSKGVPCSPPRAPRAMVAEGGSPASPGPGRWLQGKLRQRIGSGPGSGRNLPYGRFGRFNPGREVRGVFKEFREFAMRGNVVDMAVGIIIGAAFGRIVTSLVNDVIMPPIGLL